MFYVKNYIDWDQFNQLYKLDWLNKSIENADAVAYKLRPASIKATNLRLKKAQRKQKAVERQKTEIVAAKPQRDRREICLSSQEDKDNIDRSDTDPD